MKYWVISDTHFSHELMKEHRPADYEARIAKSLLSLQEGDILFHLGDICIGNDEENHKRYIQPIKARKVLVRGNHDKKSDDWYYSHGWDAVCHTMTLERWGQRILLSHIPRPDLGYFTVNVHGHLHNRLHRNEAVGPKNVLISLEQQGYNAQSLESVISTYARDFPRH